MQDSKYFGSFYPIESKIHRLNPVIKLIILFILIISIIASNEIKLHILMLFYVIVLLYYSKVPFRFYFNMVYGLRYIYIILLFLLASHGLTLEFTIILLLKINIILLYLSLLFFTTAPSVLKYGVEKILTPFNILNLNMGKFANFLVNIITFIPLVIVTEKEVLIMRGNHGLDYFEEDIISKIIVRIKSSYNTFYITIQKLKNINELSTLKMYNINKHRTNYKVNKIDGFSIILLLISLIFIIYYIIYERGIL